MPEHSSFAEEAGVIRISYDRSYGCKGQSQKVESVKGQEQGGKSCEGQLQKVESVRVVLAEGETHAKGEWDLLIALSWWVK